MPYKHGVYVSEQPTSLTVPIEGTAGLQVVFGTAPVNMAEKPYEAANKPMICYSFAEAVKNVGYSDEFDKYTLCQSIDASFRVFNVAPIILVNVLDPNKASHKKTVAEDFYKMTNGQITLKDRVQSYAITTDAAYKVDKFYYTESDGEYTELEVTVGEAVTGTVYERVTVSESKAFGVLIDTPVVKSSDGATTYEENVDYIVNFDEDGYVIITALSSGDIGAAATVRVSYSALNPDGVTAEDIIGGVDTATGALTGIECVSKVFPLFGITPGLILAPGWSDDANVIAALTAKAENINGCFTAQALVDISTNSDRAELSKPTAAVKYSDVKTAKENLGIDNKNVIACWPLAVIGDKTYALSAVIAALIAYNDASNDDVPYLYPSNKSLRITGIKLENGTEVIIDQEQANLVNSYGVVTAINYNGFKCWGNNTAAYPSTTDPKDRWIAIRRMFTWWGNTLILTYGQKVDEPANYRLIENIVDSENIRGNSFVARGIVAQARCEFRAEENPVTDILNGKVTFHIFLTPFTPAEDIEFVLEFNPDVLVTALTGGEE